MTASQDLVHRMIQSFPQLRPLYHSHLDDMGGELLPYLLMADAARWASAEVVSDAATVGALVRWLEQEFEAAGADEKDLIGLGFVEALPAAPEGDPLLERLGPSLRQVAEELGLTR